MERMRIREVADLCGGSLLSGDPAIEVKGVSTDSRALRDGELFLALKGDRFDGHDFIDTVLKKGAAGVIGERGKLANFVTTFNQHAGLIEVGDTLAALHLLTHGYRSKFWIPLIAVTGSCGKTTTKDMLAAILSQTRNTLKTEGNLNNLIGAPLMLLRIDSGTESAVIEIASNAPGEIGRLAQTLSPTAGIITNIGPVHLAGFGSIEGVLNEKCALIDHISSDGFAVINEEDIPLDRVRAKFSGKVITFGLKPSADFHVAEIRQDIRTGTEFLLNGKDQLHIPLAGVHNVLNALAAIAAAVQLGVDMGTIQQGLNKFSAASMRMELRECRGATIVNDAYNANPRAMRESISTVLAIPAQRKILALGDMLELGDYSREAHRSLGHYIGQCRPDFVYLVGEFGPEVRDGALEEGLSSECIRCCTTTDEIAASLKSVLRSGDLVLVKGSRVMRMERVVHLLCEEI